MRLVETTSEEDINGDIEYHEGERERGLESGVREEILRSKAEASTQHDRLSASIMFNDVANSNRQKEYDPEQDMTLDLDAEEESENAKGR